MMTGTATDQENTMTKPASMKLFDVLYLATIPLGALIIFLSRDVLVAQMQAEMAANGLDDAIVGEGVLWSGFVFSAVVTIALWFFVSVKRVGLVRWLIALFAAYNVVSLPVLLAGGIAGYEWLSLLSFAMQIVAAVLLLLPASRPWFARAQHPVGARREGGVELK